MNQTTTYERVGTEEIVVEVIKDGEGALLRSQSFTLAQITAQRANEVTRNTAALARFDAMLAVLA